MPLGPPPLAPGFKAKRDQLSISPDPSAGASGIAIGDRNLKLAGATINPKNKSFICQEGLVSCLTQAPLMS